MRYDIAVIGTGPAGLSAAINAKNRNRNIIIFGKKNLSDKIISAHEINNYLGLYGMTGMEVVEAFKNHIDRMGIEITEENVISVYPMDDYFPYFIRRYVRIINGYTCNRYFFWNTDKR